MSLQGVHRFWQKLLRHFGLLVDPPLLQGQVDAVTVDHSAVLLLRRLSGRGTLDERPLFELLVGRGEHMELRFEEHTKRFQMFSTSNF